MRVKESTLRLGFMMLLAGSIATCGIVGTTDLRLDRERREVQELRMEYIDAMQDMVEAQIRFFEGAESLAARSLE